jgi:hypothetical protein
VIERQQRTCVAHVDRPVDHRSLHGIGEIEQAQEVRHRRARSTERFRDLVVRQVEFLDEPRHRARLVDRIQILALQVLDQRDGQRRLVVELSNHHGHGREARNSRGAPAALAGDDLVRSRAAARLLDRHASDDQRLQHALLADRFRELGQALLSQMQARLIAPGPKRIDVELEHVSLWHRSSYSSGRANVNSALPAAIATYCLPSTA